MLSKILLVSGIIFWIIILSIITALFKKYPMNDEIEKQGKTRRL